MPPLHDPLTGRTVFVAPGRDARPSDFAADAGQRRCPFCAGAEEDTPAEVDRVEDDSGDWLTRVVPNRYPVVTGDDGAHEVVIESPRHVTRFVDLTDEEAIAAVTAWVRRLVFHREAGRYPYTLLFKNEGRVAGASLEHVHSQVVALPEAPAGVPKGARGTSIGIWSGLHVGTPAAPRAPLETWIWPPEPAPLDKHAKALASSLRQVLRAIDPPAYNVMLHVTPASPSDWWLEIVPRGSSMAGFELATGCWINPMGPTEVIKELRDLLS